MAVSNISNQSYEKMRHDIFDISEKVDEYLGRLYRCGLVGFCDKQSIRIEVRELVTNGFSEQQIMDIVHKKYSFLAPGDIVSCKDSTFIVDSTGTYIAEISLDDVFNLLGDRITNHDGERLKKSPNRSTLSGAYVDDSAIWTSTYKYAKIICTNRDSSVETVCCVPLFAGSEKPRAFLYDGMLVETLRNRIYWAVDKDFGLTKKLSRDLQYVVDHISNPSEIEGMDKALSIIARGPFVTFEKAYNSDTEHFDFINVEFDLLYNGRTYKEQVEYIKRCIKAFDKLAVTAIRLSKTFRAAGIGLNYFKADIVLSRQNVFIYKFSLKVT